MYPKKFVPSKNPIKRESKEIITGSFCNCIQQILEIASKKDPFETSRIELQIEYVDEKEPLLELIVRGPLRQLDQEVKQRMARAALDAAIHKLCEIYDVTFIKVTREEVEKRKTKDESKT